MRLAIIHPVDKTTVFLQPIIDRLRTVPSLDIVLFQTEPSSESYDQTRFKIQELDREIPILFLGHGSSFELTGGENDTFKSQALFSIRNEDALLENRKLILLSCRSEEFLRTARFTAQSSIGFGNLPTDIREVAGEREADREAYPGVDGAVLEMFKFWLVSIFSNSIFSIATKSGSLHDLQLALRLRINKAISVVMGSANPDKRILAELLYEMKVEMRIGGEIYKSLW
jgi:hypothetical protein